MHSQSVHGKVAGRQMMRFYENVSTAGKINTETFMEEVLWVIKSETRIILSHGGVILKKPIAHNDYYGYLTSTDLVCEFDALCETLSINQNSTLVAEIVTSMTLSPYFEDKAWRRKNDKASTKKMPISAIQIPDGFRIPRLNKHDSSVAYYRAPSSIQIESKSIYSSKLSKSENKVKMKEAVSGWKNSDWISHQLEKAIRELSEETEKALNLIESQVAA